MINIKRLVKRIIKYVKNNYLIFLFLLILAFVGVMILIRIFFSQEQTVVYAKIKVSQGLWWVNTSKPEIWLTHGIKKGDMESSLTGKPIIEIIEVRSYPWWNTDEYEIYILAKLTVKKNKTTGKYSFKRSTIGVGSPIDIELPNVQVPGTIIELSDKPFKNKLKKKTVTIIKKYVNAWEAEALQVGDHFYDGEERVFEVISKDIVQSYSTYTSEGNNYPVESELLFNITVTADILVNEQNGRILFGNDQVLRLGKPFNISTEQLVFTNYYITSIK